ncbi:chorismate mutase [candidate division KSB1 bacterium]|nr:chorismate mutase [candidate division KSB1 bacterium]
METGDYRERIDAIDAKIVEMLNQRASFAQAIGRIKQAKNLPVFVPEREQQILERIRNLNEGPLSSEALVDVFKRIIDVCKKLE